MEKIRIGCQVALVLCLCEWFSGCRSLDSGGESMVAKAKQDDFLWLEEIDGEHALNWVKDNNQRTLSYLQSDQRYASVMAEAKNIFFSEDKIPYVSLQKGFAYNFWRDEVQVRGVWRRMPTQEYVAGSRQWEVLLDVDALVEKENENWVYKGSNCWFGGEEPRCLIRLSRGGTDASVLREFSLETKAFIDSGFHLPESKAGASWLDEDTLLTSYSPVEEEYTTSGYPRTVRVWQRGTSLEDIPPLFSGQVTDVAVWQRRLHHVDGDVYLIDQAETFYESNYFLLDISSTARTAPEPPSTSVPYSLLPLPKKSDLNGLIKIEGEHWMVLTLKQDWRYQSHEYPTGAVVGFNPKTKQAQLIFQPSENMSVRRGNVVVGANDLYISLLENVMGKVYHLSWQNKAWQTEVLSLPDHGTASIGSLDAYTGDVIAYYSNPTTPTSMFYQAGKSSSPDLKVIRQSPEFFNAEGISTQQFWATSKDGTKIPYFVIAKKSVLESGPAPTIQYGYGGFNVPVLPHYSATRGKLWIERGGVYVIANIRGGGEFGPQWHQAALKDQRQKAFDDFYAVSEDLIQRGVTTSKKLGITGGSNGGLLMGVALTQRPDLYKAININVPLLDMLRFHKLLAGASWMGEYGNPDDPEDRKHLEAWSPYHNIAPNKDYPQVYFYTSTKDDRVHPGHARKMAARLKEMGYDFLYYENIEGGHGGSANLEQSARQVTLQMLFFMNVLGLGAS